MPLLFLLSRIGRAFFEESTDAYLQFLIDLPVISVLLLLYISHFIYLGQTVAGARIASIDHGFQLDDWMLAPAAFGAKAEDDFFSY